MLAHLEETNPEIAVCKPRGKRCKQSLLLAGGSTNVGRHTHNAQFVWKQVHDPLLQSRVYEVSWMVWGGGMISPGCSSCFHRQLL